MNTGKKIEVNSSSLVGLKAELFRKQEALRRERLQQNSTTVKAKPAPKKSSFWNRKNAGVQSRAERDKVLTAEEENALDKSRAALEAKTKLYEEMSKGSILMAEDDVAEHFLVDFEKKAISDMKEKKRLREEEEEEELEGAETEYEMGATDVPGPVDPEDQWVDYVDTLGRSRRCMKKDLPELINMDKRLNPQAFKEKEDKEKALKQESLPDLLSSDMHREMMRKKWEAEEEELRSRGPGPVHYQNLRFDEVREMGVGYFDFSKDEGERQNQMEMLSHLRDETLNQRTKSEQLKAKRKAALKARLDKVKQRKRAKGEMVEDEEDKDGEEEEEVKIKQEAESARRRQREEDERRLAERLSKTAPARPWDIGKEESQWDRVKKQAREERPQEFAPPQQYDWKMSSTRPTPKKSKFAPSGSYTDTLNTSKQPHEEFARPTVYGSNSARQGASPRTSREGNSFESMKSEDHGRQDGESNQERQGTGEDLQCGGTRAKAVSQDSIAQALSFFRNNTKK